MPPTPSAPRLRLGLPGYLILFAPLAFAPERQQWARCAPSPLVLPDINAFHRYTGNSRILSHAQVRQSEMQFPG